MLRALADGFRSNWQARLTAAFRNAMIILLPLASLCHPAITSAVQR